MVFHLRPQPTKRQLLALKQSLARKRPFLGKRVSPDVHLKKIGNTAVAIKEGSVFFRPVTMKKALESFSPIIKSMPARTYSVRTARVLFATEARLIRKGKTVPGWRGGVIVIPEKRADAPEFLVMEKVRGINFEELSKALSSSRRSAAVRKAFGGATREELQEAFFELADNFHKAKRERGLRNLELTTNNAIVESFDRKTRKFGFVLVDIYSPFVE